MSADAENDLARAAGLAEDRAVDAAAHADDPALLERVTDHLRAAAVGELHAGAVSAPLDERVKIALRARARPWLDRHCSEIDRELAALQRRLVTPAGGFETELWRQRDPATRDAVLDVWRERRAREQELRAARLETRERAARRVGAPSLTAFLAAAESTASPERLAAQFERGAIAPLDDAVAAAASARGSRPGARGLRPHEPADEPARRGLADAAACWSGPDGIAVARRLATVVGVDADAGVVRLDEATPAAAWPALIRGAADAPRLAPGAIGGPAAVRRLLGEVGAAARLVFLERHHGPAAARYADPAFAEAVRVLFRRLALDPRSRLELGLDWPPDVVADVRLEEALAPRECWAYLDLVFASVDSDPSAAQGVWRRVGTLGGRPGLEGPHEERDPRAASWLRGTVYGLLLEERMLTRFGRGWFADRQALRWLRDAWDAEPGERVESLAAHLDLGTMDESPVLDGCRPS